MSKQSVFQYLILALPGLSILYLIHLNVLGLPTNLYEVIIYLTAIFFVLINRPSLRLSHRNLFIIAVLAVVIVVALVISNDLRVGFGIVKGWLIPAALVWWMLSKHLTSIKDQRLMLCLMVAQGMVVAIVALFQQITVISSWWIARVPDTAQYLNHGRSVGLFNSPNSAAIILALSIIISAYLARRWWHYIIMLVLILALSSTGSGAGVLALVVGIIVFELAKRQFTRLAGVIIAGSLLIINPITLSLIAALRPDTADVRLHIWRKTGEMLMAHPIFGYGLTSFQNAFAAYTLHQPNFDQFITPYAVHPHNIFLYAWFLFGLAGFFGLIYAFWIGITGALKHQNALALAMLTIILIQGMVDNTVLKNDLIVWFVVVCVLTLTNRSYDTSQ